MKSLSKSCGKNFLALIFLAQVLSSACTMVHKRTDQPADHQPPTTELRDPSANETGETALAVDRKQIAELRQNIPEEKRKENDELREILLLTGETKEPPQRIREKFNRLMQRARDRFRRDSQRARAEFNRNEKKLRDDFFKKLADERDDFQGRKVERDERKKFYDDQDRRRREFTSDERDKRQLFNSDQKQKNDDFNQEARDQQQDFSQQMRDYEQRYREWQKGLKEQREAKRDVLKAGSDKQGK